MMLCSLSSRISLDTRCSSTAGDSGSNDADDDEQLAPLSRRLRGDFCVMPRDEADASNEADENGDPSFNRLLLFTFAPPPEDELQAAFRFEYAFLISSTWSAVTTSYTLSPSSRSIDEWSSRTKKKKKKKKVFVYWCKH